MSGRKFAQIFASLSANLGQMGVGHCVPLSSFLLPQMVPGEGDLILSKEEGSWFASVFVVGCLTGSLVGGYQCDYLGRRWSMMVDGIIMAMGLLAISLAPTTAVLLLGRFLTGHCSGSNLVSTPIFVSEISDPDMRGTTSVLTMACYTTGFFASMLLGAILPWRVATGVFMVTPLLSAILLMFVHESPTWLLRKERKEQAREAMFFYRGDMDTVKLELRRCQENIDSQESSLGMTLQMRCKLLWRRSLSPEFLKPFLLLNLILNVGLEWAGFPVLAFYMHNILKQMKIPFNEYWVAVALAGYRSFLTDGLSFIMYKARRRPVYLLSGCLVACGTGSLAVYNWLAPSMEDSLRESTSYLPLLAVVLMYTGFGLGYGPIIFMLQGELLPQDMRSFGSGLLGILDNISLFVSVKMGPTIISSFGVGGAFMLYSCVCLANLTVSFFTMPETKGLSLEDIEDYYKNKKK